jgi:N-methylhydantoinase A
MAGTGPMVIQEFGSTTVVFPGQSVTVDGHGIMIIAKAS